MCNTCHKTDLSAEALQLLKSLFEKILKRKCSEIESFIGPHPQFLFDAVRWGNFKFLAGLIEHYPGLLLELDEENRSIFHIAIMYRHTAIFNLIYNIGFYKEVIADIIDKNDNNLLHLAANYSTIGRAASVVPGAALEMQQELIIFKEVELLVRPLYRDMKNKDKLTPRELFTKEHAQLLQRGEKWMKQTAQACSVVASLIATVVFQAAFSVPGGVSGDSGSGDSGSGDTYLSNTPYLIFAMANAVALSSSSISILMFLYILTSRYAENDFLWSLPLKLVMGISMLLISIAAMMVAFSSGFFLAFKKDKFEGVFPVSNTGLVSLSIVAFVLLQFGLFVDILRSSFLFRISIKSRTPLSGSTGQRKFSP